MTEPFQINHAPTKDDCNLAMLSHVTAIFFSVITPLIFWLINKDNDEKEFINEHAKEALNFQITVFIGYFISGILSIILIGLLMMAVLWVANLVLCIMAGMAASRGESYRYPFTLRLVR
ncbi:MAG: DUF4870 domain-containing protein [Moraxella sp.]|nr:DUF4870 domain-containing protein [Moraxella sp.]